MNQAKQNAELLKRLNDVNAIHATRMAELRKQLAEANKHYAAQIHGVYNQLDEANMKCARSEKKRKLEKVKHASRRIALSSIETEFHNANSNLECSKSEVTNLATENKHLEHEVFTLKRKHCVESDQPQKRARN